MKIKLDFVTNSSSTAFFFTFNNINPIIMKSLFENIRRYKKNFNIGKMTHKNVINAIENCYSSKMIKTIDEAIDCINDLIDDCNNDNLLVSKTYHNIHLQIVDRLKRAKSNGATHLIMIEFGDNHGDVCGGLVGNTMDYEGRYIDIDDNDFQVFTIQNR